MKQKQKIWVWLVLASFIFSSFPINYDVAQATTVSGYEDEGIAFYAKKSAGDDLLPVYRLFNSSSTEHLYTQDEDEKTAALANGYAVDPADPDGTAFYAYPANIVAGTGNIVSGTGNITAGTGNIISGTGNIISGTAAPAKNIITDEGLIPIYRLYNSSINSRFYTSSGTEKSDAIDNLSYVLDPPGSADGIAFYSYPSSTASDAIQQKKLVPVYQLHNSTTGDYIYTASENEKAVLLTQASAPPSANLGPEISVGLWSETKDTIHGNPFKVNANKNYNIKDKDGNILMQVAANTITRVDTYTVTTTTVQKDSGGSSKKKKRSSKKSKKKKTSKKSKKKKKKKKTGLLEYLIPTAYASDKIITTNTEYLKIKNSEFPEKQLGVQEIYFDAVDGNNVDMIFDVSRPGDDITGNFDQYRGKVKVKYTDNNNIWMINLLPMEQYVWGMGEMSGTGPKEHSKVMTTIFRTYGYWYSQYATKYLPWGFRIRSDSGSQIYRGYDWEIGVPNPNKYCGHKNCDPIPPHPNIKTAAEETSGKVVTYKGDIALTPYSSWTDGHTRSFEEHWGSKDYPWCQSVSDPYGKDSSRSTDQLFSAGNHMVGLSAHGSLKLAGNDCNKKKNDCKWGYEKILKYYFSGIDITGKY